MISRDIIESAAAGLPEWHTGFARMTQQVPLFRLSGHPVTTDFLLLAILCIVSIIDMTLQQRPALHDITGTGGGVVDAKTIRQEMIDLLAEGEGVGAREISQTFGIPEREIYGHLEHIARSLKARGLRLEVEPARCLDCGFVFRKRRKLTPPGHCPSCRGSHLQRPRYRLAAA